MNRLLYLLLPLLGAAFLIPGCPARTPSAVPPPARREGPPPEARRESPPPAMAGAALKVGALAPALALPGSDGQAHPLQAADRHTVVVFYRGFW